MLAQVAAGDMASRSIAGSDQQLVDALGRYAQLGFDEFVVADFTLGDSHEARLDALASFRADIASQLGG